MKFVFGTLLIFAIFFNSIEWINTQEQDPDDPPPPTNPVRSIRGHISIGAPIHPRAPIREPYLRSRQLLPRGINMNQAGLARRPFPQVDSFTLAQQLAYQRRMNNQQNQWNPQNQQNEQAERPHGI